MGITIEQLQGRYETRNVAQWEWRLLERECIAAGNSPILNLRFRREIKPERSYRDIHSNRTQARVRKFRALRASGLGTARKFFKTGRTQLPNHFIRKAGDK